jgi:hypothetical protein
MLVKPPTLPSHSPKGDESEISIHGRIFSWTLYDIAEHQDVLDNKQAMSFLEYPIE